MALVSRVWLLGAVLLSACGGGGGNGAASPPQAPPVAPPAPNGPLALTENNAVDATALVMRQIEHSQGAADAMVLTANVLLWRRATSATISCAGNVSARLTNDDGDRSGTISTGDVLRYEHTSCSGMTRDSSMLVTLADATAGDLEGNVSYRVATDAGALIEGTFVLKVGFDHATLEQTLSMSDIDVTVATGTATASISGARTERYTNTTAYRIDLSGHANSPALGGELTFSTPIPFGGAIGEVPASGELLLTGGESRARIEPSADPAFRDDHFAYQVDAAGMGVYSAARHGRWSAAVIGFIFCWEANTRPEITSLSLGPANPTIRDQLTASYSATDPDGDAVFYFPEWRVNGNPLFATSDTLRLEQFDKGDVVTFVLRASDSRFTAVASASLTVANTPPEDVTVTLEPAVARTTDDLVAHYGARDIDRADLLQATFEWRRDGVPILGQTGQVLPHTAQAKGEIITVVVHMSDGEAVTLASASTTIQDTPPVVVLPADIDGVPYGQTLAFDVTASDADGDPIGQFVLSYGPAGMAVNPTTGRVTWPMRGPAFKPEVTMNYGVTLDRPEATVARGSVDLVLPGREKPLYRTGLEAPLSSALVVGDFDDDGEQSVLVAGANALYELEWTGTGFRQSWVYSSSLDTQSPAALATADVDGDGLHEIFVAHGGHVTKLDGAERRPQGSAGTGRPDYVIRDLEIADVDDDGRLDVVAIASLNRSADPAASATVMRFGANGMGPLYEYPISEGSALAVGNVDNDPQLEIVTNSGYVFDVFNWLAHWRYPEPFGWEIDVGDLDDNGIDEIVASVGGGAVRAYSGVTRSATWTVTNANTDAVVIADFVGDGAEEILIGDGAAGSGLVKVYAQTAPGTATLVSGVSAIGDDVPAIAVGDVDHDGEPELLWGSATPGPSITMAGGTPLEIESTTADLPYGALLGPYLGGELARRPVDAPAVLFATTRSMHGGARLVGMDATTGDLNVSSNLGAPGNGNVALTVADYDSDGTDEALLASSSGDTAYHRAYDFFGASSEWDSNFASTQNGVAVAYGDLTGDGHADLAAIDLQGVVRAYDISNNALLWTGPVLADGRDIAIAELSGSGRPEIVVAAADRIRIYSRDGNVTFVQTRLNGSSLPGLRDIEVGDIDGDGALEIFALYGTPSSVQRLDAALTVRGGFDYWRFSRGLSIERSSFARKNLVLIDDIEGDQLVVVDPHSGDEIWESPALLGTIARDGVHFVDVTGNGTLRISVATSLGMYLTR